MAIIYDADNKQRRKTWFAVGAVHRSTGPYADAPPLHEVEWQLDYLEFIITAVNTKDALEQLFEAHPYHGRGWSDDERGQRLVCIMPLEHWGEWEPKKRNPQTVELKKLNRTVKAVSYY